MKNPGRSPYPARPPYPALSNSVLASFFDVLRFLTPKIVALSGVQATFLAYFVILDAQANHFRQYWGVNFCCFAYFDAHGRRRSSKPANNYFMLPYINKNNDYNKFLMYNVLRL